MNVLKKIQSEENHNLFGQKNTFFSKNSQIYPDIQILVVKLSQLGYFTFKIMFISLLKKKKISLIKNKNAKFFIIEYICCHEQFTNNE